MKMFISKALSWGRSILGRFRKPPVIDLDPRTGTDDFNWKYYHIKYSAQISGIEKEHLLKLTKGEFTVTQNHVTTSGPTLHPNHECLYETILALNPASVLEAGCGGGDHLYNLGLLLPNLVRHGVDRSRQQLKYLAKRNPELKGLVSILDITKPLPKKFPAADVVYTQAVIMHIQAGNSHLDALASLFQMAKNQVVLMENWHRHTYFTDIKYLYEQGRLPWKPLFYFRRHVGSNRPYIMIVSRVELPLDPLTDLETLLA